MDLGILYSALLALTLLNISPAKACFSACHMEIYNENIFCSCNSLQLTGFNNTDNLNVFSLDMSENLVDTIPQYLLSHLYPDLVMLVVDGNFISSVELGTFTGLTQLDRLSLHSNRITTIGEEAFAELNLLTYLDLSNNRISDFLPRTFTPLLELRSLYVSDNQFQLGRVLCYFGIKAKLVEVQPDVAIDYPYCPDRRRLCYDFQPRPQQFFCECDAGEYFTGEACIHRRFCSADEALVSNCSMVPICRRHGSIYNCTCPNGNQSLCAYRLPVTATTTEPAAVPTMLPRATPKVERTSNGVSAGIVLGSLVGGSVGGALLFYIYSRWQKISSLKRDELQARPSTRNLIDNGRASFSRHQSIANIYSSALPDRPHDQSAGAKRSRGSPLHISPTKSQNHYAIPGPVTRPKRGDGNKSGTAAPSPSDGTVKSPGKASNSLSKEYSAYNTWQAEVSQEPYRLFGAGVVSMNAAYRSESGWTSTRPRSSGYTSTDSQADELPLSSVRQSPVSMHRRVVQTRDKADEEDMEHYEVPVETVRSTSQLSARRKTQLVHDDDLQDGIRVKTAIMAHIAAEEQETTARLETKTEVSAVAACAGTSVSNSDKRRMSTKKTKPPKPLLPGESSTPGAGESPAAGAIPLPAMGSTSS